MPRPKKPKLKLSDAAIALIAKAGERNDQIDQRSESEKVRAALDLYEGLLREAAKKRRQRHKKNRNGRRKKSK